MNRFTLVGEWYLLCDKNHSPKDSPGFINSWFPTIFAACTPGESGTIRTGCGSLHGHLPRVSTASNPRAAHLSYAQVRRCIIMCGQRCHVGMPSPGRCLSLADQVCLSDPRAGSAAPICPVRIRTADIRLPRRTKAVY